MFPTINKVFIAEAGSIRIRYNLFKKAQFLVFTVARVVKEIRIPLALSLYALQLWGLPNIVFSQLASTTINATTGTIEGTIKYVSDPKTPWRLGRYYLRDPKSGELAEAVVAITKRGLHAIGEVREPVTIDIDQKDFQFTPETTAIRAGDKVRFLNSDNHPHNVKTSHGKFSINVTMPVGGEHIETFPIAGGIKEPFRIDCVFHSEMKAWIFVFDHPWYQVTRDDGQFVLKNVPVGEYRLEAVHPAGDFRHRENIDVIAGKTSQIEIRLQSSSK